MLIVDFSNAPVLVSAKNLWSDQTTRFKGVKIQGIGDIIWQNTFLRKILWTVNNREIVGFVPWIIRKVKQAWRRNKELCGEFKQTGCVRQVLATLV